MPIGRLLRKSISESRKMALLKTDGARLLFTWLIPHLDKNGCFSGDPAVVNSKVFSRLGKSAAVVSGYLKELQSAGLIVLYEVNGDTCLYVPSFCEKQGGGWVPARERDGEIPLPSEEQLKQAGLQAIKKEPEPKSKIGFDGKYWTGITEDDTKRWKDAYPACDIPQELNAMVAWLLGDWPARRKTRWGVFINGWLSRSQDRGGTPGAKRTAPAPSAREKMVAWARKQEG